MESSDANDERDFWFDPSIADTVLANDLNQMTVDERNTVLDDVHGVRSLREEERSRSKMMKSLHHMNLALERIEPKEAYHRARSLDSHFVLRNEELRIRFLRADEFDAHKAAHRFVRYLDFLYELFGKVALTRPIYFDDLNKDEQNILREGCQQLLQCRDRTGRRILVRMGNMKGPEESQYTPTQMRISMYLMQVLADDQTTQQFGCVMVFFGGFASGETMFLLREPNIKENMRKCFASFPLRLSAVHFCFPNTPTYRIAAAALSLIAPTMIRVRVRLHLGSLTECKYTLMTFGIPGDQLPITSSERIKTTSHQRWIKYQRAKEESIRNTLRPFDGVDCPLAMDVLVGNAMQTSFKNNPGNLMYRDITSAHYQQYQAAVDTHEKTRITWRVLEDLTKAGCRILVRDRRGWWLVANTDRAREKIAHDFRETRKRLAARKPKTSVNASTEAFVGLTGNTMSMTDECLSRDATAFFSGGGTDNNDASDEDKDPNNCMQVFRR